MHLALVVTAALLAAAPQAKKDRVVHKGGAAEGTVQKDTYKEVVIAGTGAPQSIPAENVDKVEYFDAPPAFTGALMAVAQEKWAEALSALGSAEEYVNSAAREKSVVKPRAWFAAYVTYYRGLCLFKAGQTDAALKLFEKIRKEFKESRFLVESFELTLEAYRVRGNVAAMDAFDKEIDAAPAEIRGGLKSRAERQRAELLFDKGQFKEARALFEKNAASADPAVAAECTGGVIRSLVGMKDAAAVEAYCKKVLSTTTQPALLLLASNALGQGAFDRKAWAEARTHFINSVVRYHPGRPGTGIEREHERAIYTLARCYEALSAEAKETPAKNSLQIMAARTYRELATEYRSGRFAAEAGVKANRLEQVKEEEKKK